MGPRTTTASGFLVETRGLCFTCVSRALMNQPNRMRRVGSLLLPSPVSRLPSPRSLLFGGSKSRLWLTVVARSPSNPPCAGNTHRQVDMSVQSQPLPVAHRRSRQVVLNRAVWLFSGGEWECCFPSYVRNVSQPPANGFLSDPDRSAHQHLRQVLLPEAAESGHHRRQEGELGRNSIPQLTCDVFGSWVQVLKVAPISKT